MKTIKYEFNDGTVSEVEVSDELYVIHEQMIAEEKRNHWKNTRRHVSLSYLNDHEIDIEAPDSDPLIALIKREDKTRLRKAMTFLSDKQRQLIEKVFFDGITITEIAEVEKVSQPAISQRLATIYNKLKNLF